MMTADEIFEAAENSEPVLWMPGYARRVCVSHGLELNDFLAESGYTETAQIPAHTLLAWMGY